MVRQLPGGQYLASGTFEADEQFAGKGRMIILAESEMYYVTLAAEGMYITDL